MGDLHAINDAINKRAGRKLIPSILVSIFLLAIIFSTIAIAPVLFFGFIWVVIMIGIREITHAYRKGEIELPTYVLMIAASVLLISTWNGKTEGLAVSAGLTIPILMFTLLLISQKDFIKRSTSAVFITFYLAVLGGFILLLVNILCRRVFKYPIFISLAGEYLAYIATSHGDHCIRLLHSLSCKNFRLLVGIS